MWQEYTDNLIPPIAQFLEATHVTRPGQPRLGDVKLNLLVGCVHHILMCGAAKGNLEIGEVSVKAVEERCREYVRTMQEGGKLGGIRDNRQFDREIPRTDTGRAPNTRFPQETGISEGGPRQLASEFEEGFERGPSGTSGEYPAAATRDPVRAAQEARRTPPGPPTGHPGDVRPIGPPQDVTSRGPRINEVQPPLSGGRGQSLAEGVHATGDFIQGAAGRQPNPADLQKSGTSERTIGWRGEADSFEDPPSEVERKVNQSRLEKFDRLIELGARVGVAAAQTSSSERIREMARRVLNR